MSTDKIYLIYEVQFINDDISYFLKEKHYEYHWIHYSS